MKRSTTRLLPVLLVLASCGTPAQYSQQRFPDSIYMNPGEEPQVVRLYSEEDFENMAAANIARRHGRDTLVVILDDPWDYGWYDRYRYCSPWVWGGFGFGFGSYYWSRYYRGWYDPFDYWYGPYGYGFYGSLYDPWLFGWYGHRYGWYDHPFYPGGYWGGGSYRGRNVVYTPRNTTQSPRTREMRPGSGLNTRYGTPGSAGSTRIGGGTRPAIRSYSSGSGASSGSNVRTREQGYNPSRSRDAGSGTRSGSSSSGTIRSYSSGSNSSSATRSYSSSSNTRSAGGSYGGGGGASRSSGSSSHSGGGGGGRSGGRR